MHFDPDVGDEVTIGATSYRFTEHPGAPGSGMPYGQAGRVGTVYQLVDARGDYRALKVFNQAHRQPALVGLTRKLEAYAGLPGLTVCRRVVLTPQAHADLLRQHPDLLYAALMPWIAGLTWQEILQGRVPISPEQSLTLARAFLNILTEMEQEGVAHGDLSAANLLIDGIDAGAPRVELVDVEQFYAPGLQPPGDMPTSSPGYAHRSVGEKAWGPAMDRFAGAVLLAEMLGWCDERVRDAAGGETYFAEDEVQKDGDRYQRMHTVLAERWGDEVAGLLEQAWRSSSPAQCPLFGAWKLALPGTDEGGDGGGVVVDVASLLAEAEQLEKAGRLDEALATYAAALALVPADSPLHEEIDLTVARLRGESRKRTLMEQATAATAAGRWSEVVSLYDRLLADWPDAPEHAQWDQARTKALAKLQPRSSMRWVIAAAAALALILAGVLAWRVIANPGTVTPTAVVQVTEDESDTLTAIAGTSAAIGISADQTKEALAATVESLGTLLSEAVAITPENHPTETAIAALLTAAADVEMQLTQVAATVTPTRQVTPLPDPSDTPRPPPPPRGAATGATGGESSGLIAVSPIGDCASGTSLPRYRPDGTVEFRWRWAGQPEGDNYLEVRVGNGGDLRSLGRVELASRLASGDWVVSAPVRQFYRNNQQRYEWRVYYVAADGKEIEKSAVQCLEVIAGAVPPTPTPHPTRPDTDRDGVPDDEDKCRDDPVGSYPDPRPERRGCPAKDTDGDGWFDHEDDCPNRASGNVPEPGRRGCPAVDSDGDGWYDFEDQCDGVRAGDHPDPTRPGCPDTRDSDGDGWYDFEDDCPNEHAGSVPDPRPGYQGCAADDSDDDGWYDHEDNCVDEPEGPVQDPVRGQGCPAPDFDGDGWYDFEDDCPNEHAGSVPDPRPGYQGCAADDSDDDGWYDHEDNCVDEPEGPVQDPARGQGCPAPDFDGDGWYDFEDNCPDRSAWPNPDPDNPGCPLPEPSPGLTVTTQVGLLSIPRHPHVRYRLHVARVEFYVPA